MNIILDIEFGPINLLVEKWSRSTPLEISRHEPSGEITVDIWKLRIMFSNRWARKQV